GWLCDVGVLQNLCSSIPCKLFFNIVMHQVRAFDARGFKAAILVTGHYGGIEIFLRLLCEYYVMASGSPIQLYACADWELNPEYGGDHAGKIETSQLMTISPEHVDLERRQVDAELGGKYAGLMSFEPDEIASREFGEAMVSGQVAEMGRKKDELLANYKEQEDWRAPDQNRTEEIWQSFWAKVGPYADCSYEDYKNGKMNEFPGWDKV
ncbi:MAG: creatininase family protein, partial [Lentisphaeria bacterium]|nr:creatininase family protein [Lentisphaeria bacterium]